MTKYRRTSLNYNETKKTHQDAAQFLSMIGKRKTELIVKLVINYLKSCGIDDVSELDERTARKMADAIIIPNEDSLIKSMIQGIRQDLYKAIVPNELNTTAFLDSMNSSKEQSSIIQSPMSDSSDTTEIADSEIIDDNDDIDEKNLEALNVFSM